MRTILTALAAVVALAPVSAQAVTVESGATQVGDTGGINAVGGTSVASNNAAYSSQTTTPASDWVWVDDPNGPDAATYTFEFDLTGYIKMTASLSGLWGVDNVGEVFLNGTSISSLPDLLGSNFSVLHSYGANDSSLFNAGLNVLSFELEDLGGPASFRATAVVTASPVPLPAGLPLMVFGLGALGLVQGRKSAR